MRGLYREPKARRMEGSSSPHMTTALFRARRWNVLHCSASRGHTAGKVEIVIVYKCRSSDASLLILPRSWRFSTGRASHSSRSRSNSILRLHGRLTLNVLLSFAQFEREVTGERHPGQDSGVEESLWMGASCPGVSARRAHPGESIERSRDRRTSFPLLRDRLGCQGRG